MPSYGKRKDEDAGVFHEQGGMFSDDPEEISARLTAAGVFVPVECPHCGDEVILELSWPEVIAMGRHAPVKGIARTATGYASNVVCPRCYQNYMREDWGEELANKEAAAPVAVGLDMVRRWLHKGKKFARAAAGGAPVGPTAGAPVGWRMYQKGMVGGVACPACGSVAVTKLYWPDVIRLVQGKRGAGWDPHGAGFIRPLHCPACKGRVPAVVSTVALNKWLATAIRRGLVR